MYGDYWDEQELGYEGGFNDYQGDPADYVDPNYWGGEDWWTDPGQTTWDDGGGYEYVTQDQIDAVDFFDGFDGALVDSDGNRYEIPQGLETWTDDQLFTWVESQGAQFPQDPGILSRLKNAASKAVGGFSSGGSGGGGSLGGGGGNPKPPTGTGTGTGTGQQSSQGSTNQMILYVLAGAVLVILLRGRD